MLIKLTGWIFILVCCATEVCSQSSTRDSLLTRLRTQSQDTNRVMTLVALGRGFLYEKPITGISYATEALQLAKTLHFERGIGMSLNALGYCYRMTGNYTKALQIHFEALELFEKSGDVEGMAYSYHGISAVYEDQENFKEAIVFAHKVIHYARLAHNETQLMRIQSNMARSFKGLGVLDSALYYGQNSYQISIRLRDSSALGNTLSRIGDIYYQMNNHEMAVAHYRTGVKIALLKNDNNSLEELFSSLSILYKDRNHYDSAIYYARRALDASYELNNPSPVISSAVLLSDYFKTLKQPDSALKYQSIAMSTKDTMLTEQKLREQQVLALQEANRQEEKANAERENKAQRRIELEFAFVAICVISIFIFFILLSRSVVVSSKTLMYFGIIALLLSFEFINLLLHPILGKLTHHSPALMLLCMVAIAAILVPLHHRLEKWATKKLVDKNRKIRLEAAKRTIALLEKESNEVKEAE